MSLQAIPPGLDGPLTRTLSSADDIEWSNITQTRLYTNAFIIQADKVLLGYKKRGIGMGLFNGFGGKVEPGETVAQAAFRELQEESGLTAALQHAGVLLFTVDNVDWAFHIDLYRATEYSGVLTESEEMRPQWFDLDELPFDQMWQTDVHWLPLLIQGTPFKARCDFKVIDGVSQPVKWWVGTLSSPESESQAF